MYPRISLSQLFRVHAINTIYTLSLHDALPIFGIEVVDYVLPRMERSLSAAQALVAALDRAALAGQRAITVRPRATVIADRKSTRLNSSHTVISYAVFCLKKKKQLTANWCKREH